MPRRFEARILNHLSHDSYRPARERDLRKQLRIPEGQHDIFQQALRAMATDGRIEIDANEVVRLPRAADEVTGVIRMNARGFGFVIPDVPVREGDIHVPQGMTGDALSGDRVRLRVSRSAVSGRHGEGASARVIEILERNQSRFAGTLLREGTRWLVQPDGRALQTSIVVRDPHAKGAVEGSKVVVDLLRFPSLDRPAEGVITEVLGAAGEPDAETRAVIVAHGLHTEFEDTVMREASSAGRAFEKACDGDWLARGAPARFPSRLDLTGDFIFTIDPPDAKDFDDAISIAHDATRDEWTLGVHIADVANFVPAGSALDGAARERGNSTYLPRRVLPMLPETLSNGVCSLQEGVPRLTRSAIISFDSQGRVISQRLAATIIRSAKRLTYLEAQALIDGDDAAARREARTDTPYTDELRTALRQCDTLARLLRRRRLRDGMIVLSLPESDLVFDDTGRVSDVIPEDNAFTHTLIEMFMVEANEAVARTFAGLSVPLLRRIHDEPVPGALENLLPIARTVNMALPDEPARHDLQRLLDVSRGTPSERAVHYTVLRSMAKATYSPAHVGHWALASEHYAHFTSPIRRYPDLLVHRVMDAFLDVTDNGSSVRGGRSRRQLIDGLAADSRVLPDEALAELGKHCSETEIASEAAERELRTFLVLQFLKEHHLGEELPGVVTGLMPSGNGYFVTLDKYLVDGVVRLDGIGAAIGRKGDRNSRGDRGGAGRATLHAPSGRLVTAGSGRSIGIGDAVVARIMLIDLAARSMDLSVVSASTAARAESGGEAKRQPRESGEHEGRRGGKHNSKQSVRNAKRGSRTDRGDRGHKAGFKKGRRGNRSR